MSASSVDYGGDAMQEQRESALAIAEWGGGEGGHLIQELRKEKKEKKKKEKGRNFMIKNNKNNKT